MSTSRERDLNQSPTTHPNAKISSKVDTYDKYGAVFSTACFTTILAWSAVANFKYPFCHSQWFITIGALAATFTDLACLAVFIWNLYKLSKLPLENNNKPFNKAMVWLELLGSLIATVGTSFFAAHIYSELNFLSPLHLSAIPLPPEWVAPMMFLFALSFFSFASLLNFKKENEPNQDTDDKSSPIAIQDGDAENNIEGNEDDINVDNKKVKRSDLNWVNFFLFAAQIPAIGFLLYQSATGNIPPHRGFHTNNIFIAFLFIGAVGALFLLLDGLDLWEKITTGISNLASSNCCSLPSSQPL